MPTRYLCQRCTNCCKWPGQVRLSNEEVSRIATFLGLTEYQFVQQYTRLRPSRDGLALIDKGTGDECIFLEGRDCVINPVKPDQCAGFPNTWSFEGWREVCEAIPVEVPGNP